MATLTVSEARRQLSRILTRIEAGEQVVITRRGRPIAQLSRVEPPEAPRRPLRSLKAFRARMLRLRKSSAELIREMRDEGY